MLVLTFEEIQTCHYLRGSIGTMVVSHLIFFSFFIFVMFFDFSCTCLYDECYDM